MYLVDGVKSQNMYELCTYARLQEMKFSCFACQFLLSILSATWLMLFEENRRGGETPLLKYDVVFNSPEIYTLSEEKEQHRMLPSARLAKRF